MNYGQRGGEQVLKQPVELWSMPVEFSFFHAKQSKGGRESRERVIERCRRGETFLVMEEWVEGGEDNNKASEGVRKE